MTLSRTARILIALLLIAAAAFVWLNLFVTSPGPSPVLARTAATPSQAAPLPSTPPAEGAGAGDDAAAPVAQAEGAEGDAAGGPAALPFITIEDRDDAAGSDGSQAPTVVAPSETTVVGRDVVVAEFPFLVTAPPLLQAEDEPAADAVAGRADRPGTVARASVNPFSPIVVQAPDAAPELEAGPPPASPEVVEVAVPPAPRQAGVRSGPSAAVPAAPAPSAPAPRASIPSATRAQNLPRALPGGTLPIAPDLLREPRAEAAPRTPVAVPSVAIREPGDGTAAPPALRPVAGEPLAAVGDVAPLGPGAVPAAGRAEMPLVAGADPLNRYLRDRNVTFTGSVLGSVGVGVFRTIDASVPIVLALGQTLPDSDIVLTDLRGQAAEFTLGDTSQILNLDLRR